MTQAEFPTEGVALTHLLVISDLERSRHFYRDVLGATVYREYGGTSCVLNFQGGPPGTSPQSLLRRLRILILSVMS